MHIAFSAFQISYIYIYAELYYTKQSFQVEQSFTNNEANNSWGKYHFMFFAKTLLYIYLFK